MVHIYSSTQTLPAIVEIVNNNGDLANYVKVCSLDHQGDPLEMRIIVVDHEIVWPVEWLNRHIPLHIPSILFTEENLLCLILLKMGHYQMATDYAENLILVNHLELYRALSEGTSLSGEVLSALHDYNKGLYAQYSSYGDYSNALNYWQKAEETFEGDDWKIMSRKHQAVLLSDLGNDEKALKISLSTLETYNLSQQAKASMALDIAGFLANYTLTNSSDHMIRQTNDCVDFGLAFFKQYKCQLEEAMMMVDLGQIKGSMENFHASLNLFDSGIYQFKELEFPDLMYHAIYRKAKMLHQWSQNGNSQFYKLALESYNIALKYYSQEDDAETFFEIHSQYFEKYQLHK